MTDIANNPHQRASRRVALQVNGQEVTVNAEHPDVRHRVNVVVAQS